MRILCVAALAGIVSSPALALGKLANVSVIDRDTGQALPAHYHKGEYWVAGRPGAHYAIQIDSRDGHRLLAVTAVDGVNVVTGQTAAHHQSGYVFAPWEGYSITGWRKSNEQVAAFTFTSIPRSYAARTGRPDNVGVIGVALFRERIHRVRPHISAAPPPVAEQSAGHDGAGHEREESAAPEAAAAAQRGESADMAADSVSSKAELARRAPAPSLGTGHGRREHSVVTQVPFERASSRPDEVIRIRYDSHDNLVALGVIRRSEPKPRQVDPFPDSRLGYVPDP